MNTSTIVVTQESNANNHTTDAAITTFSIDGQAPTMEALVNLYNSQDRECWLCNKISNKFINREELSDDDQWHFTSCVLSWEYVHKH